MIDAQQDNRSWLTKKLQKIACDAVEPLRQASDEGRMADPSLVRATQDRVVKALSQVHFLGIEED